MKLREHTLLRFFSISLVLTLIAFFSYRWYMGSYSKNGLESSEPLSEGVQDFEVELVVSDLEVPWAIAFTSPTRMLVTERSGRVRIVESGVLQAEPLFTISEVSSRSEEGLMGLVLHPEYNENKLFYVCYAYPKNGGLVDRVEQYRDDGTSAMRVKTILDDIPAAQYHSGCELGFGPDGKLYVSTGDATDKDLAQNLNSLAGKMLRVEPDGSVPSDNPISGSLVWSLGHRNPQGFDWLVQDDRTILYEAEHGPSGFDGPGGGDEVNIIGKLQNYGWPVVSHEKSKSGMVDPLLVFTPAVAPGSLVVYDGGQVDQTLALPQFKNNLFFAMLKGEGITRVVLDMNDPTKVLEYQRLPHVAVGRVRELQVGFDGAIYFTTSNRDGRGTVRDGDDKIYRIIPKQ